MKAKALEVLMTELIKKSPDIDFVRQEALKAGISKPADNLIDLMVQVLEMSETAKDSKNKAKELHQ